MAEDGVLLGYLDKEQSHLSTQITKLEKHFKSEVKKTLVFQKDKENVRGIFVVFIDRFATPDLWDMADKYRKKFAFPTIVAVFVCDEPPDYEEFRAIIRGSPEEEMAREHLYPDVCHVLKKTITTDFKAALKDFLKSEAGCCSEYQEWRYRQKAGNLDGFGECSCGCCEVEMIPEFLRCSQAAESLKNKLRTCLANVAKSKNDSVERMLVILQVIGKYLDKSKFGSHCSIMECCEEEFQKHLVEVVYDEENLNEMVSLLKRKAGSKAKMYENWNLKKVLEVAQGWKKDQYLKGGEPDWLQKQRMEILVAKGALSDAERIIEGKDFSFLLPFYLSSKRYEDAYQVFLSSSNRFTLENDRSLLTNLIRKISGFSAMAVEARFERMLKIILCLFEMDRTTLSNVKSLVPLFYSFLEVSPALDLPENMKASLEAVLSSVPGHYYHGYLNGKGFIRMIKEIIDLVTATNDSRFYVADFAFYLLACEGKLVDSIKSGTGKEWKQPIKDSNKSPLLALRFKLLERKIKGDEDMVSMEKLLRDLVKRKHSQPEFVGEARRLLKTWSVGLKILGSPLPGVVTTPKVENPIYHRPNQSNPSVYATAVPKVESTFYGASKSNVSISATSTSTLKLESSIFKSAPSPVISPRAVPVTSVISKFRVLKCAKSEECGGCGPLFSFLENGKMSEVVITANLVGRKCIKRILDSDSDCISGRKRKRENTVADELNVTYQVLDHRDNGGKCGGVKVVKNKDSKRRN